MDDRRREGMPPHTHTHTRNPEIGSNTFDTDAAPVRARAVDVDGGAAAIPHPRGDGGPSAIIKGNLGMEGGGTVIDAAGASSDASGGDGGRVERVGGSEVESRCRDCDDERGGDIPSTPCVRICRYNSDLYGGQVCVGCFRETYEISLWSSMEAGERSVALVDAAERLLAVRDGDKFTGAVSRDELLRQARVYSSRKWV